MFSQKKIYDVIFILNSSSENGSNSNSHHIVTYVYYSVQGILGINKDKKVTAFFIILFL
jgi:hypothetical protein